MSARRHVAGALAALLVLLTTHAAGAQATRRRVPAGEVTGLEMSIEGSLSAAPGTSARWFVTLYEVLRHRDLRPRAGATLQVASSLSPDAPVAEVVTDASGRASFEVPMPHEPEGSVEVRVLAIAGAVQRVFSGTVQRLPRYQVELFTDRTRVVPGATVSVFGRVIDRAEGRPARGLTVTLRGSQPAERARRGRRSARAALEVLAPLELTTGEAGAFATTVEVPDAATSLLLSAATESGEARRTVEVAETPPAPVLVLGGRANPAVARPGETVALELTLRDALGVPVEGARLALSDEVHAQTDARGEARLEWRATALTQPFEDVAVRVTASDPARGVVEASVPVRVSSRSWYVALVAQGGALVADADNVVFARAVDASGAPLAGETLRLEGPALAAIDAQTDADGVAVFRRRVAPSGSLDACGGTAVSVRLTRVGSPQASPQDHCLPLDPDASVVLTPSSAEAGLFGVALARAPASTGHPLEVMALEQRGGTWVPIARALAAASAASVDLRLPPGEPGPIWFRARPVLADGRATVGGSALAWRGPAHSPLALEASETGARGGDAGVPGVSFIHAREAIDAAHDGFTDPRGSLGALLDRGAPGPWLQAELAARTPHDLAASSVQREGTVLPQAMPSAPVDLGLLRDPWRSRARFVRGRLGRIWRAVEGHVESAIPHVETVAHQERGRWVFNSELLQSAFASTHLGEEGASGLDGEPLDLAALVALDPAFTYDNVARRVTRQRLWQLAVRLRELVRERGLDETWARLGDPRLLLAGLLDEDGVGARPSLFDAWGRPFVLRATRGARGFLDPLPGWRLSSVGPDGREGTRDDLSDAFARVLPAGGLYAEAVDEELLLARLRTVARGRATVAALSELFELWGQPSLEEHPRAASAQWASLPARFEPPEPPWLVTPRPTIARGGRGDQVSYAPPDAERALLVSHVRFRSDGSLAARELRIEAGVPWRIGVELPPVMRVGERLRIPIVLGRRREGPTPPIVVEASHPGLEASVDGRTLELTAVRAAVGEVRLALAIDGGPRGAQVGEIRVAPSGSLRARHSGALVSGGSSTVRLPPPPGRWLRAHAIVVAPRRLARDPGLAAAGAEHPAILAWAHLMETGAADPAQLALARRESASASPIDAACLLLADAADPDRTDPAGSAQLARDVSAQVPSDLRGRAAMHAALATISGDLWAGAGATEEILAALRRDGWRALATSTEEPAEMARVSAALLLGDPDDGPGRALLERAAARTVERGDERTVPGAEGVRGDGWIGTLALAIAARQVGQDELADALARGAARRLYLAGRLGADGLFWALAASVHGAFGVEDPSELWVEIDGARQRVALEDGLAQLALRPGARELRVGGRGAALARTELRYLTPYEAREVGPVRSRVEGSAGAAPGRAAFELVVENASDEAVESPVVELTLPGAARLDEEARASLQASEAVRAVRPPDGAGRMRIELAPLPGRGTHRVSLPLRWIAAGATRGLGQVSYDAAHPERASSREERRIELRDEGREESE